MQAQVCLHCSLLIGLPTAHVDARCKHAFDTTSFLARLKNLNSVNLFHRQNDQPELLSLFSSSGSSREEANVGEGLPVRHFIGMNASQCIYL